MKKVIISAFVILPIALFIGLFALNDAQAQIAGCTGAGPFSTVTGQPCYGAGSSTYNYYSTNTSTTVGYSGQTQSIYAFSRELSVGARGNDVAMLQQILKERGYLVGRADGIFGQGTRRAVLNYQLATGLSATGRADSATLASFNTPGILPTPTPCPLSYGSTMPYYLCTTPSVNSVSGPQTLGVNQLGSWTVSASDSSGGALTYSVDWGDQPTYLYGSAAPLSYSQQSATFTHTYYTAGTYRPVFKVTNSAGRTAQTSLTVVVGGVTNNLAPAIISILPQGCTTNAGWSSVTGGSCASNRTTANVGDTVYLYGSNFISSSYILTTNSSGVSVQIPVNQISSNLMSFVVPQYMASGSKPIQVVNSLSYNTNASNTVYLTVTGTSAPIITSLLPASGPVGTTVTIYGSGFGTSWNTVNFGSNIIPNVYSTNGTSMTFTVPSYTSPACLYSTPACSLPQTQVISGPYSVSVYNANGTSNAVNFTVTGSQNTAPSIFMMSPSSGRVGTQVTINGSGFSGASLSFGGYSVPISYQTDNQITFTVPANLNYCPPNPNISCTAQFIPPTPGNYSVMVTKNGQNSNALTFFVTQ